MSSPTPADAPQSSAASTTSSASPGCLWVVATPIGNLGDFSARGIETLQRVALILCEDTRTSATLLRHHGISRPLKALHEHNERQQTDQLIQRMQAGEELALISDAGTPLVSDPGYALVRAARLAQLDVRAIPGPCALVAALSIAGLPSDRFCFEGFLPATAKARLDRLTPLAGDTRTLIFYEAPHRIVETLHDCVQVFGADREAAIARELSKRFESLYRATLGELASRAATDPDLQRGEIVLLIEGNPQDSSIDDAQAQRIHRLLAAELPPTQAAKLAARITGRSKKDFYG